MLLSNNQWMFALKCAVAGVALNLIFANVTPMLLGNSNNSAGLLNDLKAHIESHRDNMLTSSVLVFLSVTASVVLVFCCLE